VGVTSPRRLADARYDILAGRGISSSFPLSGRGKVGMGIGTRYQTLDPHPNLPPARGKAPELLLAPPAIPWTNPCLKRALGRTKKLLCLFVRCRTSAPFNDPQFLQRTLLPELSQIDWLERDQWRLPKPPPPGLQILFLVSSLALISHAKNQESLCNDLRRCQIGNLAGRQAGPSRLRFLGKEEVGADRPTYGTNATTGDTHHRQTEEERKCNTR